MNARGRTQFAPTVGMSIFYDFSAKNITLFRFVLFCAVCLRLLPNQFQSVEIGGVENSFCGGEGKRRAGTKINLALFRNTVQEPLAVSTQQAVVFVMELVMQGHRAQRGIVSALQTSAEYRIAVLRSEGRVVYGDVLHNGRGELEEMLCVRRDREACDALTGDLSRNSVVIGGCGVDGEQLVGDIHDQIPPLVFEADIDADPLRHAVGIGIFNVHTKRQKIRISLTLSHASADGQNLDLRMARKDS